MVDAGTELDGSICAVRLQSLAKQLKAEGYSQVEIADLLGFKEGYVSKLLSANKYDKHNVLSSTMWRVCRRLKISGDYFLGPHKEERHYKTFDLTAIREQRKNADLERRVIALEAALAHVQAANGGTAKPTQDEPPPAPPRHLRRQQ